jgi:predicted dehydrogenase
MLHRSPEDLGIGLIGVGRHGSRYVQHLLQDIPGVALSAVCRKSGGDVFPGTKIPVYNNYRAMIADPCVQAVVAVTPPSLCHDICLSAVRAGKPILIEKPLATTGSQARAMVAAADQAGVLLMTAQTLRFDPTIVLLRDQLQSIGQVRSATLISHIETKANVISSATGLVPLGALLELGIHLLDLVRFLTGKEILEVQCTMDPLPSHGPETSVKGLLRTAGDIVCTLDIARVEATRVGKAEWVGSAGKVTADWPARRVTRTAANGTSQEWTVEPRPTVLITLQAFVHAIRTGTRPPITGLDGCRAVEAADACYRSAERNGEWVRVDRTL